MFRFDPSRTRRVSGNGLITNLSPHRWSESIGHVFSAFGDYNEGACLDLQMWILLDIPAGRRFFITEGFNVVANVWPRFRRQASKLQNKV
jgi:hypothetical protein